MYHALAGEREAPSRYVLPARRFAQHMSWLRQRAYTVMRLSDLASCLETRRPLPARAAVVTFDDAYTDLYLLGLPTLRRFGIPATVFAVTQRVGTCNDWEPVGPLAQRPMVGWSQLREMQTFGLEIGAHSRTHRSLAQLNRADAEAEIRGSRDDIAQELGLATTTFAYPHGHTSPVVKQIAAQAGFSLACGVRPAPCHLDADRYDLPRVEMQGTWRLLHLALALWLGHVPARLAH